MDIIKRKSDVCAIAGTNADKNLVYQSILVVIGGSVLVITSIIALMENQVCIAPNMLYYHHLHLAMWLYTPDWPAGKWFASGWSSGSGNYAGKSFSLSPTTRRSNQYFSNSGGITSSQWVPVNYSGRYSDK